MPVHRFDPRPLIALFLLASALLAGCASQSATSTLRPDTTSPTGATMTTGPSHSVSDRWVPPVILHNPSPAKLDVYIVVTMGGYDRTSRETTTIGLSFGFNEQPVQFAGSERLTCNETVISLRNQVASFQLAEAPTRTLEGQTFTCTYSAGGATAILTFTIPHAPVIRSPQDLVRVTRSKNTPVTYDVQGGQLMGVVATGTTAKAIARPDAQDSMNTTLDTSAFPVGVGAITLTQILAPRITGTGTPFKSLHAEGMGMAMVSVTWV